jgi:hypothetical protein
MLLLLLLWLLLLRRLLRLVPNTAHGRICY